MLNKYKICKEEGCEKVVHCKDRCTKHYTRFRNIEREADPLEPQCQIRGCTNPILAKGYCIKHYKQVNYREGGLILETENTVCQLMEALPEVIIRTDKELHEQFSEFFPDVKIDYIDGKLVQEKDGRTTSVKLPPLHSKEYIEGMKNYYIIESERLYLDELPVGKRQFVKDYFSEEV